MDSIAVWGIHTGRPKGAKESEQRTAAAEADRVFKGSGGRGTIAVGWPEVGDLGSLPADLAAFEERVGSAMEGATPRAIATDAATLFAFAREAKEGDIVVWRSAESNDVWVGRIRGGYEYVPDGHGDYVNRRAVSWQPPRATSEFSKEALRALGQHRSFFRVTNATEEFRLVASALPSWMSRGPSAAAAAPALESVPDAETEAEVASA